jgi:hypothetical protein
MGELSCTSMQLLLCNIVRPFLLITDPGIVNSARAQLE